MPSARDVEIFRLRIVEGLTLSQTGEAVGIGPERIRQIMWAHDGIPMFSLGT
jgi:DNA-directed RNA polymerase sigma subunit (sigma70/sigma32)